MIFFSKKYYLIDLLNQAYDMHNHFLPEIDDGAANITISEEMLELYKDLGFKGMICTPHVMMGYYNNDSILIRQKLNAVHTQLASSLQDFSITVAAEYMVDAHLEELIIQEDLLLMSNRHILIEQSYAFPSSHFEQTVFHLKTKDIQPIFAHPERYAYLKNLNDYTTSRKICKFQLNALSLGLHYGKSIRQKAFQLLEDGAYHFIGTDAHRPEHLSKLKEITLSKKHFELVQILWRNNEELIDNNDADLKW